MVDWHHHITSHGVDGRRHEGLYIRIIYCNTSIYTFNTNISYSVYM